MKSGNSLISICIPLYDTEKYLRRCLDSVMGQTYVDFEVIVVDDCSLDNSYDIALEYSKNDSRFQVFRHTSNLGLGGARNSGIRLSKGRYVMLIDSDDWLHADALKILVNYIEKYNPDMIVFCVEKVYSSGRRTSFVKFNRDEYYEEAIFDRFMKTEEIIPAAYNKLYKRELFLCNKIEFPEKIFHQDVCTFPKVISKTTSMLLISSVLYYYYQRDGSAVASISDKHILSVIRALEVLRNFFEESGYWKLYKLEFYEKYVWNFALNSHLNRITNNSLNERDAARYAYKSLVDIFSIIDPIEFLQRYSKNFVQCFSPCSKEVSSFYELFSFLPDDRLQKFLANYGSPGEKKVDTKVVCDVLYPKLNRWKRSKPRVYIYGTGEHTKALLGTIPCIWEYVEGFIDKRNIRFFLGRPCIRPSGMSDIRADVILYSSKAFELEMFENVKHLRIEHLFLYNRRLNRIMKSPFMGHSFYSNFLKLFYNRKFLRKLRVELGYYSSDHYLAFLKTVVGPRLSAIEGEKLGILGSGEHTKRLFDAIPELCERIECLADSNSESWGKTKFGKKIVSPREASMACDGIFLSSAVFQDSMEKQLKEMGFKGTIIRPDDDVPLGIFPLL